MDQSLSPSSSHCSSSSSNTIQFEYDVFLSFRCEDTCQNFTSHIHDALVDKNISTFIDYNLNRGDEISSQLLRAIDKSRISVIVFCEKYASSRWCLEELAKIIECKNRETNKQMVIPIFYKVDPSHVRNQTGSFAAAFAEHKERFKENLDKVQRWKDALNEAANVSGFRIDANGNKTEAMHIKDVVKDILERLNMYFRSNNNELVGIASKIEEIVSLLDIGKEGVLSLGIWGMGGIGKTTLADAVYNKIRCQFDGHCICHVKELSERSGGIHRLQQKKISKILKSCGIHGDTSSVRCTFTWDRFSHIKLLIVFDDVSDFKQIKFFIERINWLNSKSRIIITTRNNKVLQDCGVNLMYKVEGLCHDEAVEHEVIYSVLTQNKVDLPWIFAIANIVLELGSVVLDQLSSVHKPQYALASMLLSFAIMIISIVELIYEGRKAKLIWRWRGTLPSFYYRAPSHKLFGTFKDIVGLSCAICQCFVTVISYSFIRRHVDNPIKISVLPIIFAFGILFSKMLKSEEKRRTL